MAWPRLLRLRYVVPALVLAGIAWVFLPGRGAPEAAVRGGDPYVVERGSLEETLFVNGLVKPAVTVDVRSEASGLVEAVHVEEGDRVTAGAVLVTLDSSVAQTEVQEAEASLRQAEMQQTVSELDLDEDTLELRRAELRRQQALHEQGLVSQQDIEVAAHQVQQAERAFERARLSLESGRARIQQLQAAVDRAQAQLRHSTVRSSLDAWVIRRHVEVGSGVSGVSQSTSGGTVLMTLGDATQAELSSQVTASDARRLAPGLPVRIRLDSDPDRKVSGTLRQVSAAGDVDEQTRLTTFPVTIDVTTAEDATWINIPAQAEIILEVHEDVILVPDRCLDTNAAGETLVTRRANGVDAAQVVEVGIISAEQVQILSGLDAGDTILCRGAVR